MDSGDNGDSCPRSTNFTYAACEARFCKAFLRSHVGYRYAFLRYLRLRT